MSVCVQACTRTMTHLEDSLQKESSYSFQEIGPGMTLKSSDLVFGIFTS